MAQVLERPRGPAADLAPATRPRTTWRQDLVTAALSFWMVAGGAADSWAHVNQRSDSFFTPWHGLAYSGFVALACWMAWLCRPTVPGRGLARRVPVGYGLGLVGALILVPASVGDGIWHSLLGVEVNFEAALSPTHLALLVAALLMFSAPARAAWRSTTPAASPTLTAFLPALLSLAATTTMLAIVFGHAAAFQFPVGIRAVAAGAPIGTFDFYVIEQGFMDIQFTNLLLMAVLLLSLRRWRLPFGSATVLFAIPAAIAVTIAELASGWLILAALAGGLAADLAGSRPRRRRAHLLVATVTPLALWSAYFLALQLQHGLTWSAELWSGSIAIAVLVGYALHLLVMPPPAPEAPDAEAPDAAGG